MIHNMQDGPYQATLDGLELDGNFLWPSTCTLDAEQAARLEAAADTYAEQLLDESRAANQGFTVSASDTTRPELTDLGLAARFMNGTPFSPAHGTDLRYDTTASRWYKWDDNRWRMDSAEHTHVLQSVQAFTKGLYQAAHVYAVANGGLKANRRLLGFASRAQSRAGIAAVEALSRPAAAIETSAWDARPALLTTCNVTIDLDTGRVRAPAREDLGTKYTDIHYAPQATCPTWMAFLDDIFGGDPELLEFIQRAVGYSLTGHTREQVAFFLVGGGANGKSVFLDIIRALAGEYGEVAPGTLLVRSVTGNNGGPTPELVKLVGRRLVTISETGEGQHLDTVALRSFTGDGQLAARPLYGQSFSFTPTFKLWMATNARPQIDDPAFAVLRRIILINFPKRYWNPSDGPTPPGWGVQDKTLKDRLVKELPGILNWALEGARRWLTDGLRIPVAVHKAVRDYKAEVDVVGEWLAERCITTDLQAITPLSWLVKDYNAWADSLQYPRATPLVLGQRLARHNIGTDRQAGKTIRIGIRLKRLEELALTREEVPPLSGDCIL